ncbi:winged helix DNA-binding domain-containing protein [Coprinellus micaceus]|uniref:Winged helix DNA-binding domain-containing protein n=1 Tax=Coprinellus micaceus TaxID=71717 RepID=A0A4Y7T0I9_COPMI|nr:winged helix DNA-binding domain-containing protein [Coprinellus micaceus]
MSSTARVVAICEKQKRSIGVQFTGEAFLTDCQTGNAIFPTPPLPASLHQICSSAEASRSPTPQGTESSSSSTPPETRPPHSYSSLVKQALRAGSSNRMTFQEICAFIEGRFEYYRKAPNWKASLRNHLSRSLEFRNVDRRDGEIGRGRIWELNDSLKPGGRGNVVEALPCCGNPPEVGRRPRRLVKQTIYSTRQKAEDKPMIE